MQHVIKDILFGLIFATIFCIGGIVYYNIGSKPYAEKTLATIEWPTTNAYIETSRTDTLVVSDNKYKYGYTLVYKYKVNDKEYTGTKIKANSKFSWKTNMLFIKPKLKKFIEGNEINVFYNPDKPNESFIKPASGFLIKILKYLPLLLTFPIAFAVVIWQIKGVLKTLKNE